MAFIRSRAALTLKLFGIHIKRIGSKVFLQDVQLVNSDERKGVRIAAPRADDSERNTMTLIKG